MKIRNDFVTNSYSYSFIISLKDDSTHLKKYINKHNGDEYSGCYKLNNKEALFDYLIAHNIINTWTLDRIKSNLNKVDLDISSETIYLIMLADKYDFKKYYEVIKLLESGKTLYAINFSYDFISYFPDLEDELRASEIFIEIEE